MLSFFYSIFLHDLLTAESFPRWCIQKCSYIKSECQMLKHAAMLQQRRKSCEPLKNIFIYILIELCSLFDTLIWYFTHFILLNSAVHSGPKRLGWKRGIYWTPRSERRSWTFWSTRRERPARSEGENENRNNCYILMISKLLQCDVTEQ